MTTNTARPAKSTNHGAETGETDATGGASSEIEAIQPSAAANHNATAERPGYRPSIIRWLALMAALATFGAVNSG